MQSVKGKLGLHTGTVAKSIKHGRPADRPLADSPRIHKSLERYMDENGVLHVKVPFDKLQLAIYYMD